MVLLYTSNRCKTHRGSSSLFKWSIKIDLSIKRSWICFYLDSTAPSFFCKSHYILVNIKELTSLECIRVVAFPDIKNFCQHEFWYPMLRKYKVSCEC